MATDAGRKILAGARVRRLRRELGLSQAGMAAELGISASYLNLMERNQRPVTAQVLIRLAEAFNVDPRGFAREEEARLQSELDELFADPLFRAAPVARDELREFADIAPSVAEAVQRLYTAYRDLKEEGADASGLADDERGEAASSNNPVDRVRDLIQSATNHFPELEARAEALADDIAKTGSDLLPALVTRLKEMHGIRVQVLPVDVMPSSLRRFDHHRRRLMLSELVDVHGRTFQTAYQLALIEWRDVIDTIATRLEPEQSPAKALLRVSLANYAAASLMMPYQKFLDAAEALNYDIDVGRKLITIIIPTIGKRYLSTDPFSFSPSTYPIKITDSVQMIAPTMFHFVKILLGICTIPASGLIKVRTTGMNRASKRAFA